MTNKSLLACSCVLLLASITVHIYRNDRADMVVRNIDQRKPAITASDAGLHTAPMPLSAQEAAIDSMGASLNDDSQYLTALISSTKRERLFAYKYANILKRRLKLAEDQEHRLTQFIEARFQVLEQLMKATSADGNAEAIESRRAGLMLGIESDLRASFEPETAKGISVELKNSRLTDMAAEICASSMLKDGPVLPGDVEKLESIVRGSISEDHRGKSVYDGYDVNWDLVLDKGAASLTGNVLRALKAHVAFQRASAQFRQAAGYSLTNNLPGL